MQPQFLIHHRLGQSGLHQRLPQLRHVREGADVTEGIDAGPGAAQFLQRGRTEAAEQQQPAWAQHALQLLEQLGRLCAPLQHQVAVHQIDRLRREGQRATVGADTIVTAPEALPAASLLHHGEGQIDGDHPCARKTRAQRRRAAAGAGTQIDDDARLERKILQALEQLRSDRGLQARGLVVVRARPAEGAPHRGAIQAEFSGRTHGAGPAAAGSPRKERSSGSNRSRCDRNGAWAARGISR